MKRIELFEFEDFAWFPQVLRQCMTAYIRGLHGFLRTADLIGPLVQRGLGCGSHRIIDLCSGSGGPMIDVVRSLRSHREFHCTLVLTDLYPPKDTAQVPQETWLEYDRRSVDAVDVPSDLTGMRTMVCSFHHMSPSTAVKILRDACESKQPFLAFEISDNSSPSFLWWTAIPVGFILSLIMTICVRPLTIKQIFWTYVLPVVPLATAWDGAVSNARTYSKEDLEELISKIESSEYKWEIGKLRPRGLPIPMLYLLGLPNREKLVTNSPAIFQPPLHTT